jgi:hypothetical protein
VAQTLKTLGHQSRCAAGSPGILLSIEAKVACSVATTCAPSPTAAAIRLGCAARSLALHRTCVTLRAVHTVSIIRAAHHSGISVQPGHDGGIDARDFGARTMLNQARVRTSPAGRFWFSRLKEQESRSYWLPKNSPIRAASNSVAMGGRADISRADCSLRSRHRTAGKRPGIAPD